MTEAPNITIPRCHACGARVVEAQRDPVETFFGDPLHKGRGYDRHFIAGDTRHICENGCDVVVKVAPVPMTREYALWHGFEDSP